MRQRNLVKSCFNEHNLPLFHTDLSISMATVLTALPPLAPLAAAPLTGADGVATTGASLWKDGPCVIYVLRRPGCILCR